MQLRHLPDTKAKLSNLSGIALYIVKTNILQIQITIAFEK